MKPRVALTLGDYNGIGPEVILRCATSAAVRRICIPVLVGPTAAMRIHAQKLRLKVDLVPFEPEDQRRDTRRPASLRTVSYVEPAPIDPAQVTPGRLSKDAGASAAMAIERATRMAMAGDVDAIVTGPISKQALHLAGIRFPGQTEMLQELTGSPRVAMMLVSRKMRIGLATIHVRLQDVPRALTIPLLKERLTTIHDALANDWRIRQPLIAVLALNPHAGEGGDLGTEELETIIPALRQLSATGLRLVGPLPADGFFARYRPGDFDAIVAMYHDQGLIPIKMSASGRAVNVSVGLPIVRTSPDHGTGFDIVGKGLADPSSTQEALRLAVMIAANRKRKPRRIV